MVEDRGENDLKKLQDETDKLVALGNRVAEIDPNGRALASVTAPTKKADRTFANFGPAAPGRRGRRPRRPSSRS